MINRDLKGIWWWGYLHSNGTVQLKRWFGDTEDYTGDCENNPFVVRVVEPFKEDSDIMAWRILNQKLGVNQQTSQCNEKNQPSW